MRAYADADKIVFTCCFLLAMLTTAAYGRWHYWWKSGFGRARMAMMTAFAGLTLEHTARGWITLRLNSIPDHVLDMIRLASAVLASGALLYLLSAIASRNVRRMRDPGFAADQGRLHLERTPWASDEEVGKLIATWDEMHSHPKLLQQERPQYLV